MDEPESKLCTCHIGTTISTPLLFSGSSYKFAPLTGYRLKGLIYKQQVLFVNPVGFVHKGELLCHID
jgi:hypothetical protein